MSILVVAAGTAGLALISWLVSRLPGVSGLGTYMSSSKTPKLSVHLPPALHAALTSWAERMDITPAELASRLVQAAMPEPQAVQQQAAAPENPVDKAFASMDLEDAVPSMPGILPVPPMARRITPGTVLEGQSTIPGQRTVRVTPVGRPHTAHGPHPCVHLDVLPPKGMGGQCQGACLHGDQRGKACYWTPTTATQCPLYLPKPAARTGSPQR